LPSDSSNRPHQVFVDPKKKDEHVLKEHPVSGGEMEAQRTTPPPSPGIDFTKLRFGHKLFGQIFIHPQILDKFPPKNMYLLI
jgi:hypothetical protein